MNYSRKWNFTYIRRKRRLKKKLHPFISAFQWQNTLFYDYNDKTHFFLHQRGKNVFSHCIPEIMVKKMYIFLCFTMTKHIFFSTATVWFTLLLFFSSDILEILDLLDARSITFEEGDKKLCLFFFFIADHLTFSGYLVMSSILSIETYLFCIYKSKCK